MSPYEVGIELALKLANYNGTVESPMETLQKMKRKNEELSGLPSVPIKPPSGLGQAMRRQGLPREIPSSVKNK